jgi:hypothetical protein
MRSNVLLRRARHENGRKRGALNAKGDRFIFALSPSQVLPRK